MDQEQLRNQQEFWENQISLPVQVNGVLFAIDLIFIQNLVQDSSLIGWKMSSLLLFAIALPCLAANVFTSHSMRIAKTVLPGKSRSFQIIQLAGYLASLGGVWTSIMDVSVWIGILFAIISIICYVFCANAYRDIERIRAKGSPH